MRMTLKKSISILVASMAPFFFAGCIPGKGPIQLPGTKAASGVGVKPSGSHDQTAKKPKTPNPSHAPRVTPFPRVETMKVGEVRTFEIMAMSPVGNALSYSLESQYEGVTIDGATITVDSSSYESGQNLRIDFAVEDDSFETKGNFGILINNGSEMAKFKPLSDVQITAGESETRKIEPEDASVSFKAFLDDDRPGFVTMSEDHVIAINPKQQASPIEDRKIIVHIEADSQVQTLEFFLTVKKYQEPDTQVDKGDGEDKENENKKEKEEEDDDGGDTETDEPNQETLKSLTTELIRLKNSQTGECLIANTALQVGDKEKDHDVVQGSCSLPESVWLLKSTTQKGHYNIESDVALRCMSASSKYYTEDGKLNIYNSKCGFEKPNQTWKIDRSKDKPVLDNLHKGRCVFASADQVASSGQKQVYQEECDHENRQNLKFEIMKIE